MDRQGQGAYIPQELLKELSKASNRLLIGIPCERVEGERRLALTPEAVDMLTDRGHRVLVGSRGRAWGSITPITIIRKREPRLWRLRPRCIRRTSS